MHNALEHSDSNVDDLAFADLRKLLEHECGLVVPVHKQYLFEQRLGPLLVELKLEGWRAIVDRAANDAHLRRRIVHAMTTHETSFFRDGHPFDALAETLLPDIVMQTARRKRESGPLRPFSIWCAACSTGQEAYSVAMLLHEVLERLPHAGLKPTDFRILATDISQEVLATGKTGIFRGPELRGLDAPRRERFFNEVPDGVQAKPELRRMITFRYLGLTGPITLGPLDLILCRNVLIYFDPDVRAAVTGRLLDCLDADGHLMLGSSETVEPGVAGRLERVQIKRTRCYRLKSSKRPA